MRRIGHKTLILWLCMAWAFSSCSTTKYVPDNAYLLDDVKITSDTKELKTSTLNSYLRQKPNAKWFNLVKMQLHMYSLSGRNSKLWINKFLRKIGDAPVIFDKGETERTRSELEKAVQNMGFMGAYVDCQTIKDKKKIKVNYNISTGNPYVIESMKYNIKDSLIAVYLPEICHESLINEGMTFDVNTLDSERQRIAEFLKDRGYYKFNKDFISYTADTIRNTFKIDLTLNLELYKTAPHQTSRLHPVYHIHTISFITDFDMAQTSALSSTEINDSIHYKGHPIYFKDKLHLRPSVLTENLKFQTGELYNAQKVKGTFANFSRLSALKYTNIKFIETVLGDSAVLNCYIMLTPTKNKSTSLEIEGTNSAGDLGAAAAISFQHQNLFRGSETFMIKLRGAYEAISGLQGDYLHDNYTEWAAETSLNFPNFLFPFISSKFKHKIKASTEFGIQYSYQIRPEFSRTIASASWSYKWSEQNKQKHRLDLIDIAYLYLPWISEKFKEDYISKGQNYIFEYNYQNRLIVHTGYSYQYSNAGNRLNQNNMPFRYSFRSNIEAAGNLLYLISKAAHIQQNEDGEYSIFKIPYAQYFKGEVDFASHIRIDERNSFAFHAGLGIAVPYGNAKTIPFEKQYFSGGANSVRGWAVRTLGPGSFHGDDNYLNQAGDIKFDASIEYRSKLFWKLNGAVFIDAGNIWTIRDYDNQPGGVFKFNKFYKQIALSYGIGLRLDFDFLVLRFDGGMKALNPAFEHGKKRWPLVHPNFKRDFAFHIAVGYPF